MTRLKGLVVYLYRYSQRLSYYKIVRHNQSLDLPYGLLNIGTPVNSVFWPFITSYPQIHKPAVYIPNKFAFIYFYSEDSHNISVNRLSPTQGLVENNWKSVERQEPYSRSEKLKTAFWWKPDNKVYVIAQEMQCLRFYELEYDLNDPLFNLKLIVSSKNVLTLF